MSDTTGKKPHGKDAEKPNVTRRILMERQELARAISVTRVALRSLARSDIPRMAAALAYRTIFSLVPVLVVGAAVAGSFVSNDQLESQIIDLLERTGVSQIVVSSEPIKSPNGLGPISTAGAAPPAVKANDDATPSTSPDAENAAPETSADDPPITPAQMGVDEWIKGLVDRVNTIRLDAIGIAGVVLLIWAAISMLVELEGAFNAICGCPRKRGWVRRVTSYWTVLTLGMLLLFATFRGGALVGEWVTAQLATVAESWAQLMGPIVTRVINLAMNAGLLVLAYATVPNASIRLRPAIAGAVVAGTLWEVAKSLFTLYLGGGGVEKLYGALALLPLFLLWVYVTWVVVLLGLQIAYAMQHFDTWVQRHHASGELQGPIAVDPTIALSIAALVARRFGNGKSTSAEDVAVDMGISDTLAATVLERLADRGILVMAEAESDEPQFSLAAPADTISAMTPMDVGDQLTELPGGTVGRSPGSTIAKLVSARSDALQGLTLQDVAQENR